MATVKARGEQLVQWHFTGVDANANGRLAGEASGGRLEVVPPATRVNEKHTGSA